MGKNIKNKLVSFCLIFYEYIMSFTVPMKIHRKLRSFISKFHIKYYQIITCDFLRILPKLSE